MINCYELLENIITYFNFSKYYLKYVILDMNENLMIIKYHESVNKVNIDNLINELIESEYIASYKPDAVNSEINFILSDELDASDIYKIIAFISDLFECNFIIFSESNENYFIKLSNKNYNNNKEYYAFIDIIKPYDEYDE